MNRPRSGGASNLIDPMQSARYRFIFGAVCIPLSIAVVASVSSAEMPRPAADIYRDFCAVCHSGGWQGAPVANDESEWSTRVSAGADAMFKNVKRGLNAMPAMGTCTDCTDEELKSAIAEMLSEK
jgi:cytochrome c5